MTNEPLRIAIVQTQAENAGAQEISRILALGLQAHGHTVSQVFFFRRTKSFDFVQNAKIVCTQRPSTPWALCKFIFRLRRVLRDERPDAVISFQHYGNIIAAPIARSLGLRVVIANQVSTGAMIHPLVRWTDAILGTLGVYSRIIVNSDETEHMYGRYWAHYKRRLERIDHGFADKTTGMAVERARSLFGLPHQAILLGCASRLHPLKQLDCAIRVLSLRPTLHLAIAGQGSDLERLQSLASALGVTNRLHFVGELDPSEMGAFLASLDVFLHPSRSETFGLAPVEAAQAGVPVLCNSLDILRKVLQVDGRPCSLFADANDSKAFASEIDRIISDPELVDRMRQTGRCLTERYPVEEMVDNYVRLINHLLRKK